MSRANLNTLTRLIAGSTDLFSTSFSSGSGFSLISPGTNEELRVYRLQFNNNTANVATVEVQDGDGAIKHTAYVPASGGERTLSLEGRYWPVSSSLRVAASETVVTTVAYNRVTTS